MYQNKVIFMLFVTCWSWSMTVSGVAAPPGPLRSHITGGYKNIQTRSSRSDLDCSQFDSDYDVLYHFSFLIMIDPINSNWQKSTAYMNENGTLVTQLRLRDENAVPLSIFCLKSLYSLNITNMAFPNGIVPDNLGNLKQLRSLTINNSPITNMTDQLRTLSNLNTLQLESCSLTRLPNLSGIPTLSNVYLPQNQLTTVDGLTGVYNLNLQKNLFTDIPTLNTPSALRYLHMNNNPLKNMLAITSHVNLHWLFLSNTNLSSIPVTIDRLQKLEYLTLSNNKLCFLPTSMLKLTNLKTLDIRNNVFSPDDIEAIEIQFNASNPNMTLYS